MNTEKWYKVMKIKKKPCAICCENGDCTDKYIKAKNLCAFHYSVAQANKKPSDELKVKSDVRIPLVGRKSRGGAKKGQIFDFNAPISELGGYTLSKLKKVCDYWFRKYMLSVVKGRRGNFIFCPLTEKYYHLEDIHVCHYIDRACLGLRYSEENCILCSKNSNTFEAQVQVDGFKSLHHKKFAEFLGAEKVESLNKLSQTVVSFTKDDYLCLINKFKDACT